MIRANKKLTVIIAIMLLVAVMSPTVGAYSTACEDFANSSGVGTTGGLWYAIRCALSDAIGFWDITERWWGW